MLAVVEPEEWRTRVGDRVRDRREALGYRSMRRAAKVAGIHEATWRQVETGKRQVAVGVIVAPSPEDGTRRAMARALRWSPYWIDQLLGGTEPDETSEVTSDEMVALTETLAELAAEVAQRVREGRL